MHTKFSKSLSLNIPLISAAMDTVTEANLAISLARVGGIGVIHKNMSIEEQATHVRKVKRAENTMILDPVTITKAGVKARKGTVRESGETLMARM